MKNNNIYLFYKHYLYEFKNKHPVTIITKIIEEYNKIKDNYTKFPKYIREDKEKQLKILKIILINKLLWKK